MHDPILEATGVKKEVIHDAFGFLFIVLVTVGYHTRLSSCILIIWLGVMNFFVNDFWNTTNDLRWVFMTEKTMDNKSLLGDMTINDLIFSKRSQWLAVSTCCLHLALVTFPLTKTKKIIKIFIHCILDLFNNITENFCK